MRIATWNVQRPKARSWKKVPALASCLRRIAADVWVLTETNSVLSPGTGYAPVSSTGSDRQQEAGESWVTIWSRLPVLAQEPTADPVRAVCAVLRQPSGRPLIVYGTVLPWLGSPWRTYPASGGTAFEAALRVQVADWLRLRRAYPDAALCLAGDLNQDLQARYYYGPEPTRGALRTAIQSAGLVPVTEGEHDPVWLRTNGARASIDHICLCEWLMPRLRRPAQIWPDGVSPDASLSDHFGVWIDLAAA